MSSTKGYTKIPYGTFTNSQNTQGDFGAGPFTYNLWTALVTFLTTTDEVYLATTVMAIVGSHWILIRTFTRFALNMFMPFYLGLVFMTGYALAIRVFELYFLEQTYLVCCIIVFTLMVLMLVVSLVHLFGDQARAEALVAETMGPVRH